MQQKSSHTSLIIGAIVIAALGLAYFFFMGSGAVTGDSLLSAQTNPAGDVGNRELMLLNQIRSLKIDVAFFSSPIYQVLKAHDYSVAIPVVNVGRVNPFAPIPGSAPVRSVR